MIIAVNGRISSGKDTVAKIIQLLVWESRTKPQGDLFPPKEIVEALQDPLTMRMVDAASPFKVRKFADKLKEIASILLGDPDFVRNWENGGKEYRNEYLPEWGMTRRQFLLNLGTKALRDNFHTDVHVISTFADYTKDQNWVITDMRFRNEHSGAGERKAIRIRVNRHYKYLWPNQWQMFSLEVAPKYHNEQWFLRWLKDNDREVYDIVTHPSETDLEKERFDAEIGNNSTLEILIEQVKFLLTTYRII